ncbi:MAG TPA: nuclear transport factor 2 family protein [Gemmatimonadales bacterium]|nr:nuclear transport factor 2 family protein [Gemmatimonadales bacterium]
MTTATMSIEEVQIRALTDEWADALRGKDIDGVMSHYAPDVVVFGITPPLQYDGARAHRKHWETMFASYDGPLGYQIRELAVTAGADVAHGSSVNRISGLRNGVAEETWIRVSLGYRKIDGEWKVTHEHASVPFNPANGMAVLELQP